MRRVLVGGLFVFAVACGATELEVPDAPDASVTPGVDASIPEKDGALTIDASRADASTPSDAGADVVEASVDAADAAPDADAGPPPDTVTQVSPGGQHTCFLFSSGIVKCAGKNYVPTGLGPSGERLGDGPNVKHQNCFGIAGSTSDCSPKPVTVLNLTDAVEISVGGTSACARRAGGTVVCWGENNYGQAGIAPSWSSPLPSTVLNLADAVRIHVGDKAACALRATGDTFCWGSASEQPDVTVAAGQTAVGTTTTCVLAPTGQVSCGPNGGPYVDVPVADATYLGGHGSDFCAARPAGRVSCWGGNAYWELANGTRISVPSAAPTDVVF